MPHLISSVCHPHIHLVLFLPCLSAPHTCPFPPSVLSASPLLHPSSVYTHSVCLSMVPATLGLTAKHLPVMQEVLARLHEEAQLLAELSDQPWL